MKRINIFITDEQHRLLTKQDQSMSELIRRALDLFLESRGEDNEESKQKMSPPYIRES